MLRAGHNRTAHITHPATAPPPSARPGRRPVTASPLTAAPGPTAAATRSSCSAPVTTAPPTPPPWRHDRPTPAAGPSRIHRPRPGRIC